MTFGMRGFERRSGALTIGAPLGDSMGFYVQARRSEPGRAWMCRASSGAPSRQPLGLSGGERREEACVRPLNGTVLGLLRRGVGHVRESDSMQ